MKQYIFIIEYKHSSSDQKCGKRFALKSLKLILDRTFNSSIGDLYARRLSHTRIMNLYNFFFITVFARKSCVICTSVSPCNREHRSNIGQLIYMGRGMVLAFGLRALSPEGILKRAREIAVCNLNYLIPNNSVKLQEEAAFCGGIRRECSARYFCYAWLGYRFHNARR